MPKRGDFERATIAQTSAQRELFAKTHARRRDPGTSKRAARLAGIQASGNKGKILRALDATAMPLTFEQVAERAGFTGRAVMRLDEVAEAIEVERRIESE